VGWIFLINVSVALIGLAAAAALVPESRAPQRPGIDVAGASPEHARRRGERKLEALLGPRAAAFLLTGAVRGRGQHRAGP
jgi:hypothetical protein